MASTNLLTQEMLTLQGIIFRRRNGLVWCRTLDIAMIGNLRRSHRGPPKYGEYLTTTRLQVKISKIRARHCMRNDPNLKLLNAHQQRSTSVSSSWFRVKPPETRITPL